MPEAMISSGSAVPQRWRRVAVLAAVGLGLSARPARAAGQGASAPPAPATTQQPSAVTPAPTPDQLYDLGRELFDQYAPPEVKKQYEFPSKQQWDEFAGRLEQAMRGNSLADLAAYEPQARAALAAMRSIPGYEAYADWLSEQLDMIEAAGQAVRQPGPTPPRFDMPYFNLWLNRLRGRPEPANAARFMPELRSAFAAEGVPANLAWMAEVESHFNPDARSPVGAVGLFQLMPSTARACGLSTWLPDERKDPKKCARAAAQLLSRLHRQFGHWPLALAAYNAGPGRVARLLAAHKADTFAAIADALPAETRLYVPKIYATIALRTGLPPGQLGEPAG